MAIVSNCTYDAQHRLVRPSQLDISRAKIRLDLDTGGLPTFDRDRVHVFVVSDSGVTPGHARDRVNAKLQRFHDRAGAVLGYRGIAMHKTEGVNPLNHNTSILARSPTGERAPEVPHPVHAKRPENSLPTGMLLRPSCFHVPVQQRLLMTAAYHLASTIAADRSYPQ